MAVDEEIYEFEYYMGSTDVNTLSNGLEKKTNANGRYYFIPISDKKELIYDIDRKMNRDRKMAINYRKGMKVKLQDHTKPSWRAIITIHCSYCNSSLSNRIDLTPEREQSEIHEYPSSCPKCMKQFEL